MNQQPDIKINKKKGYFSRKKDYFVLLVGIISVLYLLNFTFGFVEFLPDALPIVGNLDEVVMTGILIYVLNYFNLGFLTKFMNTKKK